MLSPDFGKINTKPTFTQKLRVLASVMDGPIEEALRPRDTNTPKRLSQARAKEVEGQRLRRTQALLEALADAHDSGTCPEILQDVKSKKESFRLMASELEHVQNGFHAFHVCTGKPRPDADNKTLLAWVLASAHLEKQGAKQNPYNLELRRKIDAMQFNNIPGYFPTTPVVLDIISDFLRFEPGAAILEPSAGKGDIADFLMNHPRHPGEVYCIEKQHSLCEILRMKENFTVEQADFLSLPVSRQFDAVVMNPPFEKAQDIDHVTRALDWLAPGGRLIAVMSPASEYRTGAKFDDFRDLMAEMNAHVFDLPQGAFKQSGTGINTVLVVIDKN